MRVRQYFKRALCGVLAASLTMGIAGCQPKEPAVDEKYQYEGIEYVGKAEKDNFALLYNTLGYEQKSTKKAFVRSLEYVAPEQIGSNSLWTLLDKEGNVVSQGPLAYRGLSYGLQLWEADFSDVQRVGTYRLVAELTDAEGAVFYQEMSLDFLVQNRIFSQNVILPLTLYNAQARVAPESLGGGYYDCNTTMGEAYSHGSFLNGLVQTYVYQRAFLSQSERDGLQEAAAIAFDYLKNLHQDSGEFLHSDPRRYNADINQGFHNTYEALYGFSAYLYYFSDIDPDRANQENYERAAKSVEYLNLNLTEEMAAGMGYPNKEYLTPVYYYLYKFSGDEKWKDMGIEAINKQLDRTNLRTMYRTGSKVIPLFEGVYLFMKEFPDHPDYATWVEKLTKIKDEYYKVLVEENAFAIQPISEGMLAEKEWDNMWQLPTGEYADIQWQLTSARAPNAMDACFLGELTGDKSLEEVATGELGYILGLNAGFSGDLVVNPTTDKKHVAGAFVQNLPGRTVRGWSHWEFPMQNDEWMSIMNGFRMIDGDYYFADNSTDDWYYGEVFIRYDGAFAYAFCVYENFVNAVNP